MWFLGDTLWSWRICHFAQLFFKSSRLLVLSSNQCLMDLKINRAWNSIFVKLCPKILGLQQLVWIKDIKRGLPPDIPKQSEEEILHVVCSAHRSVDNSCVFVKKVSVKQNSSGILSLACPWKSGPNSCHYCKIAESHTACLNDYFQVWSQYYKCKF